LFAGTLTWRPGDASDVSFTLLGDPTSHAAVEGAEAHNPPLPTVKDERAVLGDFRDGGWAATLRGQRQMTDRLLLNGSVSHLTDFHQHAGQGGSDDGVAIARVDDILDNSTYGAFGRFIQ